MSASTIITIPGEAILAVLGIGMQFAVFWSLQKGPIISSAVSKYAWLALYSVLSLVTGVRFPFGHNLQALPDAAYYPTVVGFLVVFWGFTIFNTRLCWQSWLVVPKNSPDLKKSFALFLAPSFLADLVDPDDADALKAWAEKSVSETELNGDFALGGTTMHLFAVPTDTGWKFEYLEVRRPFEPGLCPKVRYVGIVRRSLFDHKFESKLVIEQTLLALMLPCRPDEVWKLEPWIEELAQRTNLFTKVIVRMAAQKKQQVATAQKSE